MNKFSISMLMILIPLFAFGQFKEQADTPSFSRVLTKPTSNIIFGFINPDKLDMQHSFSMSYLGMGKGGMMVNSYTNTINYRISDPVMLRLNLGIMNSPYNSFNNPLLNSAMDNTQFFGGAELFYKPTENSMIKLGVDVGPRFRNSYFYNDWYGW